VALVTPLGGGPRLTDKSQVRPEGVRAANIVRLCRCESGRCRLRQPNGSSPIGVSGRSADGGRQICAMTNRDDVSATA
jgi:hypothetical protein